MNKISKMTIKLAAVVQILALTLAACTAGPSLSISICHATGDTTNPYDEITSDNPELLNAHLAHPNDFTPVPAGGCPTSEVVVSDGQITICHATGDTANPYNEITVSVNGLNGHGKHEGDVIPESGEGCPASPGVISSDKITICHATGSQKNPYTQITISVDGLNGHGNHEGDIIPAPESGCPTTRQ